ncbi:MAG: hypothetical protein QM715_09650 [Nibricoccus sp.]
MPRIPSKGLLLSVCLSASVALAAVAYRLNSPSINFPRAPSTVSSRPSAPALPNRPVINDDVRNQLSAALQTSVVGDAATMQALETLTENPAAAVDLGRQLMREFPGRADEIGTILIGALVRGSHHASALEIAQYGPDANRAEWLQLILSHWARTEPDAGNLIVDQLRQNAVDSETFALVAKNWAASAPAELGRYALALPASPYRSAALAAALDPWIQQDPSAVANCATLLTEPVERNIFFAALASKTDAALHSTSQRLRWAETITDPELRRDTLDHVVREWSANDPAAARRYLAGSSDFNPEQRQTLLAALNRPIEAL